MHEKTFNVEKYGLVDGKGRPVRSFKLREHSVRDDEAAIQRLVNPSDPAASAAAMSNLESELLCDAFVEVNGEPVAQPFVEWKDWPSRTADFIRRAHRRMNNASARELEDFEQAAFGSPQAARGESA